MSKRGRILRDPANGPGLVFVDGQQFAFSMDGVWRSATLPQAGAVVDVDFNVEGNVAAMIAVPESQLAKEQTERALAAAKEKGSALASSAVARFGLPTLIASGALLVGWFFLPAVTVDGGFIGKFHFTFWHVLGLVNSSNAVEAMQSMERHGSAGLYGLLAIVTLAGPFVSAFWKDKRAVLGGLLPLVFMLLVGLMARHSLSGAMPAGAPAEFVEAARKEIMQQISLGLGVWVSLIAAAYLGFLGVKRFLVNAAS
jgi:hypothetical protein